MVRVYFSLKFGFGSGSEKFLISGFGFGSVRWKNEGFGSGHEPGLIFGH